MTVDGTLKTRHNTHGDYQLQSLVSMNILRMMKMATGYYSLSSAAEEALILIAVKIGRILTGNANEPDHWHDIAGYATLVENILNGKQANGVISTHGQVGAQSAQTGEAQCRPSETKCAAEAWDFPPRKVIPSRTYLGNTVG